MSLHDALNAVWVRPDFMVLPDANPLPLRYLWDDTRASKDYRYDAGWLVDAMQASSTRAQMVLCVGLYEWIVWRFEGLHTEKTPRQVLEAAWLATVDPAYMAFFELPREAWQGPVLGPLWCAMTWLRPALTAGDCCPDELTDGLDYLTRLAFHVWPDSPRLQAWLHGAVARLLVLSPSVEDDIFADLFDQRIGARRGALISWAALSPSASLSPQGHLQWLHMLLGSQHAGRNPFVIKCHPAWIDHDQWQALAPHEVRA
ncbi:MAG: hypothetical protein Q7U28_04255 [Aquabacterium sp.]|nr:hypothetical protein [Aquabacterium sp.]